MSKRCSTDAARSVKPAPSPRVMKPTGSGAAADPAPCDGPTTSSAYSSSSGSNRSATAAAPDATAGLAPPRRVLMVWRRLADDMMAPLRADPLHGGGCLVARRDADDDLVAEDDAAVARLVD